MGNRGFHPPYNYAMYAVASRELQDLAQA